LTISYDSIALYSPLPKYNNSSYDSIWIYYEAGKFKEALLLSKQAINRKESYDSLGNERGSKIYNMVGAINYRIGDYSEALKYYDLALQLSKDKDFTSVIYGNIANIFLSQGDLNKSITYYNKAISGSGPNDFVTISNNYSNLGIAYYKNRQWEKSIEVTKKSIEIAHKTHLNDLGDNFTTCAIAYQKLGNFKEAEYYFKKSLFHYKKDYGERHYKTAIGLSNFADLLLEEGHYEMSYTWAIDAYGIFIKTVGFKHPYTSVCLKTLGNIYFQEGKEKIALSYFQQSLIARLKDFNDSSIYTNPDLHQFADLDLLDILKQKAYALERLGNSDDKEKNLKASVSTLMLISKYIEKLQIGYLSEESKLRLASEENEIYSEGVRISSCLFDLTKNRDFLNLAFEFSERQKYQILHELRNDIVARSYADIPNNISEKERALSNQITTTKNLLEETNKKEKPDSMTLIMLNEKLFDLTREQENLIKDLENKYPEYYRLKYQNKIITAQELQKYLRPNQALIEYTIQDSTIYIFSFTKDTFVQFMVPADTAFYNSLNYYTRFLHCDYSMEYPSWRKSSYGLYKSLILPVEQFLKGKDLIIVPDNKLSAISFEPLTTEPYKENTWNMYIKEPYLLYKYPICYSLSATLLAYSKNKSFPVWKNFIGYAPDYTNSPEKLDNIPEGYKSLRHISLMFLGKAVIGKKATEYNFKHNNNYSILNLYTHGIDDTINPSLSKMFFFPDTIHGEDGYLYAYEVSNMQLRTNLVTLIACYSGSGSISKGEGVLSIGRSFVNAGTPSMIISLWAASTVPAFEIMKEFYWELLKGNSKTQALRIAKIKYFEKESPINANPQLWSELILVGNPDPIFKGFILKVLVLPCLIILTLVLLIVFRKRLFKLP